MSDNARFHNKLHRKNHHTSVSQGYPDSATDPIASATEPFMGDFNIVGDINVTGALNTVFNTLSNINIPVPVLSSTIGFNPTNSLIIQLSGTQYAIPVTYVGPPGTQAPATLSNSITGNVGFGVHTPLANIHSVGSTRGSVVSGGSILIDSYCGFQSSVMGRTANGTQGTPTATTSDQHLVQLLGRGYGVTGFTASSPGAIRIVAAEQYTDTANGAYVTFDTTLAGTNKKLERVRIDHTGNVGIGTTKPTTTLTVSGSISATNVLYSSGGNSNNWNNVFTNVKSNSAGWNDNASVNSYIIGNSATFDYSFNNTTFAKLSSRPYTLNTIISSIYANTFNNRALGGYSGVLAGFCNTASGYSSIVAGGGNNVTSGNYSAILGGLANTASGQYSAILGGRTNNLSGNCSFILGSYNSLTGSNSFNLGSNNTLSGNRSFTLGSNNALTGNNTFILGSSICANKSNYTLTNNLSSQCLIQTPSAYSNFLNVGPDNIGVSLPNTVAQFFSNTNCYGQINVQNTNSGCYASADVVITANNGDNTQNYLDLGINSSGYINPAYSITGPGDAYIYSQSCNLTIGTALPADILLHTGGTLSSNERVRITSTGSVGIGTSKPTSKLTVVGDISASGNAYFTNTVYIAGGSPGSIRPVQGNNTVANMYALVGGGCINLAAGDSSVVAGGYSNQANCDYSNVGGGRQNAANGAGSVIGGGESNNTFSSYGSILGGSCNSTCCYGFVGGGFSNNVTGAYSVINGGRSNTNSGAYSSIVGGQCNTNGGCCNFIAGGICNTVNTCICNAFVLGSNINATQSGYTYTNGIIANGTICATNAYIPRIYSAESICTASLSAFCSIIYNSIACDSRTNRNNIIGGDLTVLGTIYSPFFDSLTGSGTFTLSGNKYSTVLGDGVLSSFTVNHNLSTTDVVMTVIDYTSQQVVYPSITIVNSTQVQVGFSFIPPTLSYKISIIGL